MTSTRETNTSHDRPHDDPQSIFTHPNAASIRRASQRTGIDTFMDDMVRTPGEGKLVWDIDWNQYVNELMVHTVQTSDGDNGINNDLHHINSALVGDDIEFYEEENVTYMIANAITTAVLYSLIDRGANGGVAGDDMRPIKFDRHRTLDVTVLIITRCHNLKLVHLGHMLIHKTDLPSSYLTNMVIMEGGKPSTPPYN